MADTNGNHAVSHNSPPCMRALTDAQPTDWVGDWGHLFCADHKLWSKTSITRWANAISIQQPYHLHKQWVQPGGNEPLFGSLRKWGLHEEGGGGRSSTLTQPQCYQVLHVVRVRQRKRGKMCTINMGQDVISQGFHQFYPRYLMNTPQLWSVHAARDMPPVKVFFLPPMHDR